MAFAPTKPWKLPFITTWGGSPNRNLPTNSAEEAELIPETGQVAAWGDARASGGLAERVLGLLGRLLSRRFSRFSHIAIFSQLLSDRVPVSIVSRPVEELVVVIAVPVVLIVVIVVPVAALFFIPFMVVGNLAMIAIPVAVKVLLAIMMRCHPRGAVVGWTGPVSLVPLVAVAHRVLVAGYPNIPCARTWWLHPHYTVRRRRPDSHSDGNLSEDRSRGPQHQYKQFNLHDFDSLSFNCVMNAD